MQVCVTFPFRAFSVLGLIIPIFFSGVCSARGGYGLPSSEYYLGLGAMDHNAGVAATSATSGDKPFLGQIYTQLNFTKFFSAGSWIFSPTFNYSLSSKTSPEGSQKTSVSTIGLRTHFAVASLLDLHIGAGIMAFQIKSTGGSILLNNGSGTSVFATPAETRASNLIYWDLGTGYQMGANRFEVSVYVTKISDTSKRAITPLVTFSREVF